MKDCDTFIVEVYNDGDDITRSMHYVNIEKRTDENGNVKYVVHNGGYWSDDNGNDEIDKDEYHEKEFDSLEAAIKGSGYKDNGQPIMVIGLEDPDIK